MPGLLEAVSEAVVGKGVGIGPLGYAGKAVGVVVLVNVDTLTGQ